MTNEEFREIMNNMDKKFNEKKEQKRNYNVVDIYEFIKGVRNDNVENDMALDACIIAERMFNNNNCY